MTLEGEETTAFHRLLTIHDASAMEYLYRYSTFLEIVLRRRFGGQIDGEDRKDIVADALLHAWETRDRFDPHRSSLKCWLAMIVVFKAREFLRRNGMGRFVRLDQIDAEMLQLEDQPRGEQPNLGLAIKQLLEQLPARRALVMKMHYDEGRPIQEIATRLHISQAAVASHLSQGRASLRRVLLEERVAA